MLSINYLIGSHFKVGFFQIFPYTGDLDNLETGTSVHSFRGRLLNGEYSSNFFKRKIKSGKTILVEGKIKVEINSLVGTIKLEILETVFKNKDLTFKQKYKQPTKKLLKVLKESQVVSFSYFV